MSEYCTNPNCKVCIYHMANDYDNDDFVDPDKSLLDEVES